jgi:trigger factor
MQVIDKSTTGLKREFNVVVTAAAIEEKVEARLVEVGQQVRLPGFRPGKVPKDVLRKRFGQSVRGEVLERTIDESTQAALSEKAIKPALQPRVELVSFDEGKDLEFAVQVEVLPEIAASDFGTLELVRDAATVQDSDVDKALADLARSRSTAEPVTEARGAENGDVLMADFVGRIDGETFEGGTAQNATIDLGANAFIPGFEEQLVGIKVGETRMVKVTFPADYPVAAVAGKPAEFEFKLNELRRRIVPEVNEDFAKAVGADDLAGLRARVRDMLQGQLDELSRLRLKRQLLDKLAASHSFPVPQGMLDAEFDAIWRQVEEAKKAGQLDAGDVGKSDDELRTEYRAIAERRVRLGLLLSDVGQKHNVTVAPEDFSKAVMAEARRYPGQESAVVGHYQRNPQAVESLRAPLFEEKVVDLILGLAKVTDRPVSIEDLQKDPDAA